MISRIPLLVGLVLSIIASVILGMSTAYLDMLDDEDVVVKIKSSWLFKYGLMVALYCVVATSGCTFLYILIYGGR